MSCVLLFSYDFYSICATRIVRSYVILLICQILTKSSGRHRGTEKLMPVRIPIGRKEEKQGQRQLLAAGW